MSRSPLFKIRMPIIDLINPVAGLLVQAALGQVVIESQFSKHGSRGATQVMDPPFIK